MMATDNDYKLGKSELLYELESMLLKCPNDPIVLTVKLVKFIREKREELNND